MKLSLLWFLLFALVSCSHQKTRDQRPEADGLTIAPMPPPQPDAPDIGGPGIPPPLFPETPPPQAE